MPQLAHTEDSASKFEARSKLRAELQMQEMTEVAEALAEVQAEERESFMHWDGEIAGAQASGCALLWRLTEAEASVYRNASAKQVEVCLEETDLRAEAEMEAAEEWELEARLAHAELQIQRRVHARTASPALGGASGAGGGADLSQMAKALQSEAEGILDFHAGTPFCPALAARRVRTRPYASGTAGTW